MARQMRHNVEDGWYHITTRGMARQAIFSCAPRPGAFHRTVAGTERELRRIQGDPAQKKAPARRPETEVDVSEGLG